MKRLKHWLGAWQLSLFDDVPTPLSPTLLSEPGHKIRTITLDGQIVPYIIERTRRRTVGMVIDSTGLRVRANSSVNIAEIERILHSKTSWLLKNINKQWTPVEASTKSFVPDLEMLDGTTFKLLGRDVTLYWVDEPVKLDAGAFWREQHFEMTLSKFADKDRAQTFLDAVVEILQVFLNDRAQHYAKQFNLSYRCIMMSGAKTLWGTCRTDGTIRINWRLAFIDAHLVEYVLVHELAHTVHMNHSKQFWAQVEKMCPDYKTYIKALKKYNLRNA